MSHKRFSLRVLLFLMLAAAVAVPVLLLAFGHMLPGSAKPSAPSLQAGRDGLTLRQALLLAAVRAKKWAPDAAPLSIASTDSGDTSACASSGDKGKRHAWNVYFGSRRHKGHVYLVSIVRSRLRGEEQDDAGQSTKSFQAQRCTLDSAAAVKLAAARKSLKPGSRWAKGFHFNLGYVSYGSGRQMLVLEVVGLSPSGKFAHVDIDEQTGKIVDAQQESYNKNGDPVWSNF